mgnify:CR=1 FL=1|tara:strand:- start:4787 stop:5482 length:696 start_codon:yes stop_codon:yes gene_type:complete
MIKLFELFYDTTRKPRLTGCIPYLNTDKSIYVENKCLVDIAKYEDLSGATHIGTISQKFHEKVLHKPTYKQICKTIKNNPNVDIFSPGPPINWWFEDIRVPRPLYWTNQCGIKEGALPLLNDMSDHGLISKTSIKYWTKNYNKAIYCNYWVAKKNIYIDYVQNFLLKVIEISSTYSPDHPMMRIDLDYPTPPPVEWQAATGLPGYPAITFILERLINMYVLDRKLNHKNII